jgi:hypothetical protein
MNEYSKINNAEADEKVQGDTSKYPSTIKKNVMAPILNKFFLLCIFSQ